MDEGGCGWGRVWMGEGEDEGGVDGEVRWRGEDEVHGVFVKLLSLPH